MAENKNLTLADDEKLTLEMKTFQMVGVDDYNALLNRPKINGVEVSGEKSLDDYGMASKMALNAHIANQNNPHAVKATQIGAFSLFPTEAIPSGADLNDLRYLNSGVYTASLDAVGKTIKNSPVATAFNLYVRTMLSLNQTIAQSWSYRVQEVENAFGAKYFRSVIVKSATSDIVYGDWQQYYSTANKPNKTDVGLGNVDNTADVNKSVKNAQTVNNHTVNSDVPEGAKFTDTTYSVATATADGLMSAADKTKLDGLNEDGISAITTAEIDTILNE